MNKMIYALYDLVGETVVGGLMMYPGDGAAVRGFKDVLSDPKGIVAQHPGDFELLFVGEFDVAKGMIVSTNGRVVIRGDALVAAAGAAEVKIA